MQQPQVNREQFEGSRGGTRELTIKGASIRVYDTGQGDQPMLFLHGAPDTYALWLPVIERLKPHARCIAPDLPGFGASTLPRSFPLTLDNEADFIRALLGALDINEPVTLVMTDFGAHYGLAFAVKYPDLVRGLVISNSNFFPDYQWHSFAKLYRMPLIGELLMAGASKSLMSSTLKRYAPALPDSYIESSHDSGFGSPVVRKAMLRYYRERNPQDFAGWDAKLIALLQTKPALVLWGDKDPFITPAYGDRWGTAQVKHFADFSHWLPLEAPEAYADAISEWMSSS